MTEELYGANFDLMLSQVAILSALPIEEMLALLERAETLGPIVDPTLAARYLHSGKGEALKALFRAVIGVQEAARKAAEMGATS